MGGSRTKIALITSVLWESEGVPNSRVNYLWLCEYYWTACLEKKSGVNNLGIAGMNSSISQELLCK